MQSWKKAIDPAGRKDLPQNLQLLADEDCIQNGTIIYSSLKKSMKLAIIPDLVKYFK